MWNLGGTDGNVLKHPGRFALAVIKQFRSNQGILLAGAVAYLYVVVARAPADPGANGVVTHFCRGLASSDAQGLILNLLFQVSRMRWSRRCEPF
jgi:hypothetical protein